ncbi:M61 family metallopeptidase [Flagellimonas myxillae]|uniref:M61 family metallopeptidase n=1 Tax=Flagellimonas myxillae TaxID=2942214 RepID=UPI00201F1E20|nr:PDZ domain-containing protein [Muricauda myxillae]MCL6267484.1 PDZ domain-containing protein [Muricauda myxillae]
MKISSFFFFLLITFSSVAQVTQYEISFENAVHHEAVVKVAFTDLPNEILSVRMSRTSPGRYALHEFAKNVYALKAMDSKGKILEVKRPNPYEWQISGHDGTVILQYTLYANRGDGTYAQIDETHAHLNIPATFMYAPSLANRKIEVTFKVRQDLGWKVATQLPLESGNTYSAPNLYYFMDSPTEISNFTLKSFELDGQIIQLALHHNGTEEEADTYFEKVRKTVLEQKEVYGELPKFDYGTYTFLACYVPNASGDGMEHRNSTILTSTRSLANGGLERNVGTVSHEFFHAWNVERIRPKSLEPFNFEAANMSGELWFAEGFTSYYTNLILCRAGLITPKEYVEGLTGTFNYVWTSPARQFFNPIEMSYQAPFVDAATSVDPVNRENTFISYYSYGSVLGLALDLSLRKQGLNLDDYMKLVWNTFGKKEVPYTITDLHETLNQYAGKAFGDYFFQSYIYESGIPDYTALFGEAGVYLVQDKSKVFFGSRVSISPEGGNLASNPVIGSPAYKAGLAKGDVLLAINNIPVAGEQGFSSYLEQYKLDEPLQITYSRHGAQKETTLVLKPSPSYTIGLMEDMGETPSQAMLAFRKSWLKTKQ